MKSKTFDDLNIAVVEPKGSLVGGDVLDDLKATSHDLLAQGNRRLVIDLSNVDLVNSTGLGTLISLNSAFNEAGGHIKLCGLDKRIRNVFVLTRLSEVFDIEETQSEAVAVYRSQASA